MFHRISSCSVIPKIAYSDMLHQHQVTPLLTLRYLQYLCELTQVRIISRCSPCRIARRRWRKYTAI
ncbi:hypothetical protein DZK40_27430 [Klebsiella pneumoniae]|nr:hypothetical protein DZK40_27430 [Klebsiella pneumoniae]RGE28290.1 hypothetical protein DZK51_25715 [Klebsiella pneumoniae]